MNDNDMIHLLQNIKTIALVGASEKPNRASYHVMEYLLAQGYQVIPVNPKLAGERLLGQQVYATLSDIPEHIDMVDVFRNATEAYSVAKESIAIGAKVLWLQLGIINLHAETMVKEAGMLCVMDRCPKIEIPRLGLEKA